MGQTSSGIGIVRVPVHILIPKYLRMIQPVPRTPEGYHRLQHGLAPAISRTLKYAPYADLLWLETSTPDLDLARSFAREIRERSGQKKWMVYNLSPSFNWLDRGFTKDDLRNFIWELGKEG